jgi:hypothetical protein
MRFELSNIRLPEECLTTELQNLPVSKSHYKKKHYKKPVSKRYLHDARYSRRKKT